VVRLFDCGNFKALPSSPCLLWDTHRFNPLAVVLEAVGMAQDAAYQRFSVVLSAAGLHIIEERFLRNRSIRISWAEVVGCERTASFAALVLVDGKRVQLSSKHIPRNQKDQRDSMIAMLERALAMGRA
jgi:hypothetical protein